MKRNKRAISRKVRKAMREMGIPVKHVLVEDNDIFVVPNPPNGDASTAIGFQYGKDTDIVQKTKLVMARVAERGQTDGNH